jgi:hypothetical protein
MDTSVSVRIHIQYGYVLDTPPKRIHGVSVKKIKPNKSDIGAIHTGLLKAQNRIRIGPRPRLGWDLGGVEVGGDAPRSLAGRRGGRGRSRRAGGGRQ